MTINEVTTTLDSTTQSHRLTDNGVRVVLSKVYYLSASTIQRCRPLYYGERPHLGSIIASLERLVACDKAVVRGVGDSREWRAR